MNTDLLIYTVHALFWSAFGITRIVVQRSSRLATESAGQASVTSPATASYSRAVLAIHFVAFALLYFGLGTTVNLNRVPGIFFGQSLVGTLVMAIGSALMCWALAHFASWRLRAKLDAGHRLATEGPFRWLRHPIYMGLNLLAIGSAILAPAPVMWAGALLMCVGSDVRARAEEKLLAQAFGATYTDYCAHTRRFVPGIY
jgi:protein-S-isoprenylcysteine O-methyltransferase Ste14